MRLSACSVTPRRSIVLSARLSDSATISGQDAEHPCLLRRTSGSSGFLGADSQSVNGTGSAPPKAALQLVALQQICVSFHAGLPRICSPPRCCTQQAPNDIGIQPDVIVALLEEAQIVVETKLEDILSATPTFRPPKKSTAKINTKALNLGRGESHSPSTTLIEG